MQTYDLSTDAAPKPPTKKACVKCGKLFTPVNTKQRYCNVSCLPSIYAPKKYRACAECKKQFLADKRTTICSDKCRKTRDSRRQSGKYTPVTPIDIWCLGCGKVFKGKKCDHYCSEECRAAGYKRRKQSKHTRRKAAELAVVVDPADIKEAMSATQS